MNDVLLTTVTAQPSAPAVGALDAIFIELIHASPELPVMAKPPLRTVSPVVQLAVSDDEMPPLE